LSIYGWPHRCSSSSSVGIIHVNLNSLPSFLLMLVSPTARRNTHWDKCLSSTPLFPNAHPCTCLKS
jgi:hypothetical protein